MCNALGKCVAHLLLFPLAEKRVRQKHYKPQAEQTAQELYRCIRLIEGIHGFLLMGILAVNFPPEERLAKENVEHNRVHDPIEDEHADHKGEGVDKDLFSAARQPTIQSFGGGGDGPDQLIE